MTNHDYAHALDIHHIIKSLLQHYIQTWHISPRAIHRTSISTTHRRLHRPHPSQAELRHRVQQVRHYPHHHKPIVTSNNINKTIRIMHLSRINQPSSHLKMDGCLTSYATKRTSDT
jgi:hypothetical protein